MSKNWENGAKWPALRKSARATNGGLRNGIACMPARFAQANHVLAWGRGP